MTAPSVSPSLAAYGSVTASPLTSSAAHLGTTPDDAPSEPGDPASEPRLALDREPEPSHRLARASASTPSSASIVTSHVTPSPRPDTGTPNPSDDRPPEPDGTWTYEPTKFPVVGSTARPFDRSESGGGRGRTTTSRGDATARTLTVPIGARSSSTAAFVTPESTFLIPESTEGIAAAGSGIATDVFSEMTVASHDCSPALTTTLRATMSSGEARTRRLILRESHTGTGGVTT